MAWLDAAAPSRALALRISYSEAVPMVSSSGILPVKGSLKNFSFMVMHLQQSPTRL